MMQSKKLKLLIKFILATLFSILICFGVFTLFLYRDFQQEPKILHSSKRNGLWAGHGWVGSPHLQKDYQDFCTLLENNHINEVFFHVGPLNAEGLIETHKYPYAQQLIIALKKECPEISLQAWIGQIEKRGGGPLNLSDQIVQKNIVKTAETSLQLGFDGIHYDVEPICDDDARFIDLLEKTRELTQKNGKLLSVATDELEPFPGAEWIARRISPKACFWSEDYYRETAKLVDQIAVMLYDTAMPKDWLYAALVKSETRRLLKIMPPRVMLFIGVPTYEDRTWGFNPDAENVASSLRGIQKALEGFDSKDLINFGVALYAEWTTGPREWKEYRNTWLQPKR